MKPRKDIQIITTVHGELLGDQRDIEKYNEISNSDLKFFSYVLYI